MGALGMGGEGFGKQRPSDASSLKTAVYKKQGDMAAFVTGGQHTDEDAVFERAIQRQLAGIAGILKGTPECFDAGFAVVRGLILPEDCPGECKGLRDVLSGQDAYRYPVTFLIILKSGWCFPSLELFRPLPVFLEGRQD